MKDKIINYIRAGYPALYLVSPEEQRVEAELKSIAKHLFYHLLFWSTVDGLVDSETGHSTQAQDPIEALQAIEETQEKTIVLLKDFHLAFEDPNPILLRSFKNLLQQVYEDVLGNVVYLGLVSYPEKSDKLVFVPLWKDKLVLICHPKHSLAKRKSIKLTDIDGQKFIAFEPDIPTRKAIDKILKEYGVTVQNVMEFDNIETVKRAVEIDSGISIVPETTIVQELAKKTLAAVEFQDGEFLRPSAAIYKKNRVLSPAMKQFLAILKE
jgi:DNA-binding transcriptional LysR family regulator